MDRHCETDTTAETTRRALLRGIAGGAAAALLSAGWAVETSGQETSPGASPEAGEGPVVIVVHYGQPVDPAAFEAYFWGTHVPIAVRIPGYEWLEAGQVLGMLDGSESSIYRIAELHFASRQAMETALASPEGQATFADVPNFATGGATALIVGNIQIAPGTGRRGTPTT